jgi:hypothetical protein
MAHYKPKPKNQRKRPQRKLKQVDKKNEIRELELRYRKLYLDAKKLTGEERNRALENAKIIERRFLKKAISHINHVIGVEEKAGRSSSQFISRKSKLQERLTELSGKK